MIDHGLVPNRLELIYLRACSKDYNSPRCRFVRFELNILSAYLNPYSKRNAMQIFIKFAREIELRVTNSYKCLTLKDQSEPLRLLTQ